MFAKDVTFKQHIPNLEGKSFLITGGSGKLAFAFSSAIKHYLRNASIEIPDKNDLNIEDLNSFKKYSNYRPDFILHCGAHVNADFCETNLFEARQNIVEGTKNVVKFAIDSGAQLLYPQSFLIYDGQTDPVDEDTLPNPLSNYGKLKWEAENVVAQNPNSLIIRMGGFFGGGERDTNFVGKFSILIRSLLADGISDIEVGNRVWQPTYTKDLAENSLLLMALQKAGVYIMAGHKQATFFEVAKFIVLKLLLEEKIKVIEMSSDKSKLLDVASRPMSINMMNKRLLSESLDFQRDWKVSLNEYLDSVEYKSVHPFEI
jgi:dTDP-4-dehydrorhamnose reductase